MAKQNEQYICDRFCGRIEGKLPATTTEISTELGVSYQAIHRILKKHGLTRKDGGKAAQVAASQKDADEKVSVMCEKYKCTKEQWDELRAMDEDYKKTPLAFFHTFKNNFQNLYPDVEFKLTMWEWWTIWNESGMWGRHKRNPEGMYVMAQRDKSLPFDTSNSRIIPFGQLLSETRKMGTRKAKVETVEELDVA